MKRASESSLLCPRLLFCISAPHRESFLPVAVFINNSSEQMLEFPLTRVNSHGHNEGLLYSLAALCVSLGDALIDETMRSNVW